MALLSIEGMSKNFGGLQALSGVSLTVEKGEITALIGPNGAGKTTLFNIISGLDRPSGGRVFFNGERIDGLPSYEIVSKGIARSFQIARLFGRISVLENVMVGRHVRTKAGIVQIVGQLHSARAEELATREYAMDMLRFVNLAERANDLASALPQGQQRLVELARALASEPTLLLLDEPTSGLNPSEIIVLQKILKLIQGRGITIFLIEHQMRLVMSISDKVVVLNYGREIAEGPPETISKEAAVIEAYLGKESVDAAT